MHLCAESTFSALFCTLKVELLAAPFHSCNPPEQVHTAFGHSPDTLAVQWSTMGELPPDPPHLLQWGEDTAFSFGGNVTSTAVAFTADAGRVWFNHVRWRFAGSSAFVFTRFRINTSHVSHLASTFLCAGSVGCFNDATEAIFEVFLPRWQRLGWLERDLLYHISGSTRRILVGELCKKLRWRMNW